MKMPQERRIMTYYQFVEAVEQKVREELKECACVSIHTAQKYNGTFRRGILFCENGSNISPTIYLEEYYRQFRCGGTIDLIAEEILRLYRKIRFRGPWKEDAVRDYEELKGKLVYRLIHREKNRELLKDMPYMPYLDLAIVFYVLFEAGVYGTAAMPVKTEHLKLWNVSKEQVYARACWNTEQLLPFEFRTMRSVLAELTDIKEPESGGEEVIYVLSNSLRCFGAAAVLYPGRLEEIGEYLKEDYYVLPSSVHEMIVIRKSAASGKAFLSAMVAEINATQVEAEEVLSDHAYYYDRAHKKLSL